VQDEHGPIVKRPAENRIHHFESFVVTPLQTTDVTTRSPSVGCYSTNKDPGTDCWSCVLDRRGGWCHAAEHSTQVRIMTPINCILPEHFSPVALTTTRSVENWNSAGCRRTDRWLTKLIGLCGDIVCVDE
jgi:hypothetical protein